MALRPSFEWKGRSPHSVLPVTVMTAKPDRTALLCFVGSLVLTAFLYGAAVGTFRIFPYKVFALASDGLDELRKSTGAAEQLPDYYRRVEHSYPKAFHDPAEAYQGLNLITRFKEDHRIAAEVTDMDGKTLHRWNVDWFTVWPDADHLPPSAVPKSRPGCQLHGAVVMDNGDLVYNYDHLGLVRLARDGGVVWRLPYQTHHSIQQDDDGNLWVCGQKPRNVPDPDFKGRTPPYDEYTILRVSHDGEILREWSIPAVLKKNGYHGLLYLGSDEPHVITRDDRLHLNDAEPFPRTMADDFFDEHDVLVSLRNVNTIFVFDRRTERIKFITTGRWVWQHDPDFIDGNSFTLLDNDYRDVPDETGLYSRIVAVDARTGSVKTLFRGTPDRPFYTSLMGKHQWLPNGNLLITASMMGRAFEVNVDGSIVWQYVNYIDDRTVGLVEEVQRLPPAYGRLFGEAKP